MVSLVDLAPARKKITLREQEVEFRGISLGFLVTLLRDSEELRLLLAEKKLDGNIAMTLIAELPDMVAQCIAAASGKPGDDATVAFVLTELSPGEWLICMEAIIPLTFPQGVSSFAAALAQAARSLGLDVPGWEADTKSQEASTDVSDLAIHPRKLGNSPRAKSEPTMNSTEESATQSS